MNKNLFFILIPSILRYKIAFLKTAESLLFFYGTKLIGNIILMLKEDFQQ